MYSIGQLIKELREEKGLNQRELAKAIKATQGSVTAWENDIHEPKASYIIKLAKFFNESADYILGLDGQRGKIVIECGDKPPKPSKETLKLIDLISKLPPIDQANAVGYIKGLQGKK